MIIKVFRHIYHLSIYTISAIILTIAVCVSLIRLYLPNIDEYRVNVETWITEYMDQPVKIKNLDATWYGWIPHLYINDITVLNESRKDIIANFKSATITIDIIKSLQKKQLVPASVGISGLDLTLIRKKDGSINIAKTDLESETGGKNIESTELAVWLLKQPNISFTGTNITLLDQTLESNNTVLLSNVSILLRSNNYRLQLEGNAQLPEHLGERIDFALDAKGDILTSVWSGELYLEGSSIYPPAWFDAKIPFGTYIKSNPGNIKIWSEWQNAKVRKIEGTIDITDVNISTDETNFKIDHLVSELKVDRRTDGGIDLSLNIEKLSTDNGSWPASTIYISKYYTDDDHYRYISKSSYLKLDDISHIVKLFPELWRGNKLIEQQSLRGILSHSLLIYDPNLPDEKQYFFDTDIILSHANFGADKKSIDGLAGHLQGNVNKGKFTIDTNRIEVGIPDLFDNNIDLFEVDGDFEWQKEDDNFHITTEYFDAHTNDFNAFIKGKLIFKPGMELPFADIVLGISNLNVEDISNYLPKNVSEKARNWFKDALIGGTLSSVDVVLRGNLSDYPFKNNEGQFKAIANIENTTLDYSPNWAPVDSLDAELIIEKNNLIVNVGDGNIFDADIKQVKATINDLTAEKLILEIDGIYSGHTNDGKLFIKQSPLAKNPVLKLAEQYDLNGRFDVDLKITIHFDGSANKYDGKVTFFDTSLVSPVTNIKLKNINGDVYFNNESLAAEKINATYFDHDVYLGLSSDENGLPVSTISGNMDRKFIIQQLGHYFPIFQIYSPVLIDRVSGSSEWQAELSIPDFNDSGIDERKLKFRSSLLGLTLDLPAPIGKSYEAVPFEMNTVISKSTIQDIIINYGNFLSGSFKIDKTDPSNPKITTNLLFGQQTKQPVNSTENGMLVTGNIEHLTISEWMDFIKQLKSVSTKDTLQTYTVAVDIASLGLMNQQFENVSLGLSRNNSLWNMDFNGDKILGKIEIPQETTGSPVSMNFDRLHIIQTDSESSLDPKTIPPLQVAVEDFQYEDINLGKFLLETSNTPDGMNIDNFSFAKTGLDISGRGVWSHVNDQSNSNFAITLHASSMDAMLGTFNYGVTSIKDGETNIKINAHWDGSPPNFSLNKLNGGMQLDIDKGQFLDIDPKAGRLFGLLSIQTLPRRLSLDFSDLFSKGMSFDEITGDFNIENGNAYTNNLAMKGPSADIAVTGRTGLSDKDYDQLVTVTPQIADSLPIASALFGPVGLGVGAVLFLAGEMFESIPNPINKLLSYQYTITGTWDDPVIEKLSKKQDPKEDEPVIDIQKQNTSFFTQ